MPRWTGLEVRNFAQAERHPEVIYAAANVGVFRSIDRGRSWTPMKLPTLLDDAEVFAHPDDELTVVVVSRHTSGYLFSNDGGQSWAARVIAPELPQAVTGFVIDPARYGGVWWAATSGGTYQSRDQGKYWERFSDLHEGVGEVVAAPLWIYRLAGQDLYRSAESGKEWVRVKTFDGKGYRDRVRNFLALSDGRLKVWQRQQWLESRDHGVNWSSYEDGFKSFASQADDTASTFRPPANQTSCRVLGAPTSAGQLLAACIWDNGAMPSNTCLKSTNDLGMTWASVGKDCRVPGLPTAWRPISILQDRTNPDIMLAAWMAGGVYRSEDAGATWTRADAELLFRGGENAVGGLALNETPLFQAVLMRDSVALQRILTSGIKINEPGNYFDHILAADLFATKLSQLDSGSSKSMYSELRRAGAVLRPESNPQFSPMRIAAAIKMHEVVEDLINDGYDWGSVPKSGPENQRNTEFRDHMHAEDPGSTVLGRPLKDWIERYIRAAKFPSADQTAADLMDMGHVRLAVKVVKAASRVTAFDRQSTPTAESRLDLSARLEAANERYLALMVLRVAQAPSSSVRHSLMPVNSGKGVNCKQGLSVPCKRVSREQKIGLPKLVVRQ